MEITKADYQSWKHHPVSKVFLKYLGDRRAFIQRVVMDKWVDGTLSLNDDKTMRGQIIELFELEHLPFEAIEQFYQEIEEENGAQTPQDG